ncbi:MAG: hypothetical protein A3G73_09445 [Rhodospirillales bacterium RIFCSPLOWO2_12_FULL_67_15]|nr:MAG: hypothetical protein A3G73_09445 [Rhodospirillales bacterium RIFCSPLOWO2_12_FULL_67_15]
MTPVHSLPIFAPLIFSLLLATPAAADECRIRAPAREPEVTFALQTGPITWHTDQTREQIRALRANSGARVAAVGPNWQSIGLTLATFVLAVDVRVVATPVNPARAGAAPPEYCARLIAADVKFGASRLDAYVARDYRRGTCPHRVVRDHEERHVAIYRAAVERLAPRIETRLQAAARELPLVRAANAKAGAERLRKILHDDLSKIFDAMGREMEAENRALDTPEAYANERKLCPRGEW